ncbi:HNH endonuclease [Paucibacter sp. TC2R-5]|uniref:HNH endonuclease n=1 Tax=Paucibacter sp. TC2R-5 TaxID=2893555 RepID=UPI0021E4AC9F|nr:HNH endonuclease signature motif containing protein [Paucibacter sp. TC2R-5]MCV2361667.1 HNH endonuclease [Paucibacter sp. TC2R-5]
MSKHFIQYHKLSQENPVPSGFSARTKNPVKVVEGDIVWLLTARPSAAGTHYAIAYCFVVDAIEPLDEGGLRFSGQEGQRFDPAWALSAASHPWFEGLRVGTLGSGAFGFRPIPAELISVFDAKRLEASGSEGAGTSFDDDADAYEAAAESAEQSSSGSEDEIQMRAVLTRRGQRQFRAALLQAYGRRCPISESRVEALLEAAHIVPHAEGADYQVSNGLLLRADLHTLFDLHLLGLDAQLRVHLHPSIKHSEYARFDGKRLESLPSALSDCPSPAKLQSRFDRFLAKRDELAIGSLARPQERLLENIR